jgi:hypothetical protein
MGTKAALAHEIAASFETLPSGPLLDLFAGMSAVGRAVAPTRNLWLNDMQAFSRIVSEFQFLDGDFPPNLLGAFRTALSHYHHNLSSLEKEHRVLLSKEDAILDNCGFDVLRT